MLLTGFLLLASTSLPAYLPFLQHWGPPAYEGTSHGGMGPFSNYRSRKCPTDTFTGQPAGCNSPTEVLSSQVTLVYVKLTAKAQYDIIYISLYNHLKSIITCLLPLITATSQARKYLKVDSHIRPTRDHNMPWSLKREAWTPCVIWSSIIKNVHSWFLPLKLKLPLRLVSCTYKSLTGFPVLWILLQT